MTNKPNVKLTETDLSRPSLDDQMRESWEYLWSKEDEKLLTAIGLSMARPHYADAPVFVFGGPTSPNKSHIYEKYMRNAFPKHQVLDERHVSPAKPFTLHSHQQATLDWICARPHVHTEIDAFGGINIDTESYFRQGMNAHLPMFVRPMRSGFGGHMDSDARDADTIENIRRLRNAIHHWPEESYFEYPSIGGQFKLFSEHFGFNIISDEYVAPPKPEAKDWDKNARHWYKAAMGGKPMMNMAIAAYRASKHSIYQPEFDWENQREARRKLHFIKHVNVGTVGHIDWGNNRLKRTRPYVTGYLADCIREAIKEFK